MSKERDLLTKIQQCLQYDCADIYEFAGDIVELLAQPEQDLEVLKKDWVNFGCTAGRKEGYDQGFNDGKYLSSPKREPLSESEIAVIWGDSDYDVAVVRRIEKAHGIGGGE